MEKLSVISLTKSSWMWLAELGNSLNVPVLCAIKSRVDADLHRFDVCSQQTHVTMELPISMFMPLVAAYQMSHMSTKWWLDNGIITPEQLSKRFLQKTRTLLHRHVPMIIMEFLSKCESIKID